jgi:hypothetical protein
MQQFHKFITWHFCVVQHVSGASTPYHQELTTGQITTNNAATTNAPTVKPEAVNAVVIS